MVKDRVMLFLKNDKSLEDLINSWLSAITDVEIVDIRWYPDRLCALIWYRTTTTANNIEKEQELAAE